MIWYMMLPSLVVSYLIPFARHKFKTGISLQSQHYTLCSMYQTVMNCRYDQMCISISEVNRENISTSQFGFAFHMNCCCI